MAREALRRRASGSGDTQALASLALDRAEDMLFSKRFDECYEIAKAELPAIPIRLDLWYRMLTAVMRSDRDRVVDTLEAAETNPFRGRLADLYKHACRAGLAAVDGDFGKAEAEWRRAHGLAAECLPIALEGFVWAIAGHSLGSSQPYGLEIGRRAHALFSDHGATTLLDVFATGVFEPEERAADTA
jgi:hypothetical protein